MKYTIKDRKSNIYPMLKIRNQSGGKVIGFFSSPTMGTIIYSVNSNFTIGTHNSCWAQDHFDPFDGEVTLSND